MYVCMYVCMYVSLTYDMGYDTNLKWDKWDLGTPGGGGAVQFNILKPKLSTVGNESQCKSLLVRIYKIVPVIATEHTKDSFFGN